MNKMLKEIELCRKNKKFKFAIALQLISEICRSIYISLYIIENILIRYIYDRKKYISTYKNTMINFRNVSPFNNQ